MFLLFSLYPLWFARTPTACESTPHPFELPNPADLTACQRPLLWRRKDSYSIPMPTSNPRHLFPTPSTLNPRPLTLLVPHAPHRMGKIRFDMNYPITNQIFKSKKNKKIEANCNLLNFLHLNNRKCYNFATLFTYLDVQRTSHQGRWQRKAVNNRSPLFFCHYIFCIWPLFRNLTSLFSLSNFGRCCFS